MPKVIIRRCAEYNPAAIAGIEGRVKALRKLRIRGCPPKPKHLS
jgi:hypothetical protein